MTARQCVECSSTEAGSKGWCRGLCSRCYGRNLYAATLDRYPTLNPKVPPLACLRCGLETKHKSQVCRDCREVTRRITEDIPALEGEWIRHNLVHRFHAA